MDDDWSIDQPAEKKQNTPVRGTRGKREQKETDDWNQDDGKGNNEIQLEGKTQSRDSELDESNWLADLAENKQQKKPRENSNRDQTTPQDTSFLNGSDQPFIRELEREDPNTSCWVDQTNNKQNQPIKEKEAPRRGNRGRNQEQTQPKRRDNREIKEQQKGDEEVTPRRGNRYREVGAVGDFKKKKTENQFYQPRENNYQRNERGGYRGGRGNRGGRGGYNNYHNNNYNASNNYNPSSNYNNSNNYNGSSNYNGPNNYNRGGFRPKYEEQQQGKSSHNNFIQREQRSQRFQKKNEGSYGGYQNYNNNNYNNNYNRNYNGAVSTANTQPSQIQQKVVTKQPKEPEAKKTNKVSVGQTALMVPKGRKCWPESSINILGCRIVVTSRHLLDFRCKLLVVPYSTVQMEYYPGNAVNSSSVDYRKKILNKGSVIEKPGSVYLQKAIQVYSFQALAFVRINKYEIEQSLKVGIKQLLRMAEVYEKPITLESIVFAICQELGDPKWVIDPFFQHLQNCRRIKEVWITTVQGECYVKAAGAFTKQVQKIFKANEIFLN